jgi:hypothetical protein
MFRVHFELLPILSLRRILNAYCTLNHYYFHGLGVSHDLVSDSIF